MTCEAARQRLAEDLSSEGEARAHLEGCLACQAHLVALRQAVAAVERLPLPTPPPELRGRVLAAVAARRPAPRVRRLPALAAASLLLVAVVLAGRPHGAPPIAVLAQSSADLHPSSAITQHTLVMAADPLADATALHMLGALALRQELAGRQELPAGQVPSEHGDH